MRSATWRMALGLCLLAASVAPAQAARRGPPPHEEKNPSQVVTGYGETVAEADRQALAEAARWVVDYLRKNYPSLAWSPSGEYLRNRDLVRPAGDPTEKDLTLSGHVHAVNLRVEITPEFLQDSQRYARQQRMGERHYGLALGLAGVMALLSVVGGYLWLEDMTRGFYTRLLRVAGAVVLLLVGMGLFLLR